VPGVLDTNGELIREMSIADARKLIENGVASGGMIPKLETCIAALDNGVEAAVILDGRTPHVLLMELFTEHGAGTLIH
jgi:acetylglutamate kinase